MGSRDYYKDAINSKRFSGLRNCKKIVTVILKPYTKMQKLKLWFKLFLSVSLSMRPPPVVQSYVSTEERTSLTIGMLIHWLNFLKLISFETDGVLTHALPM